ncbi:hypothetical protein NDU88_007687 [Pleurodeles waltl]|uniref:Uncharacterized protein n=1 Tax=Pleurodeles waltl TaxID=8319 RepID=A0AAV7NU05_PLEWA|nr:hypothetical protein NDU88_007687 [Pleurodeles waltl]
MSGSPRPERKRKSRHNKATRMGSPSPIEMLKERQKAMEAAASLSGSDPGSYKRTQEDLEQSESEQESELSNTSEKTGPDMTPGTSDCIIWKTLSQTPPKEKTSSKMENWRDLHDYGGLHQNLWLALRQRTAELAGGQGPRNPVYFSPLRLGDGVTIYFLFDLGALSTLIDGLNLFPSLHERRSCFCPGDGELGCYMLPVGFYLRG